MDRARFLREQQVMGRLSGHLNIVHVLQAGITYTGRPYIVMPFHRRDSLDSWITTHGALTVAETLAIGVKLAGAWRPRTAGECCIATSNRPAFC